MVAADLAPLDRQVRVPAETAGVEADSTVMGLSAGEVVTLRDLMYGVFLSSGNDAAETLAGSLTSREHFIVGVWRDHEQSCRARHGEVQRRDRRRFSPCARTRRCNEQRARDCRFHDPTPQFTARASAPAGTPFR